MARLSGIQRIMEVGMIVCSMFALYLLLALASFDPADPSWSQAGFREDVQNAAGAIGAWFADILLNSFGYIAYAFPFGIALLGWFLFQQTKDLLELDYLTIGLRLIGGILSIIGATALFSLNADDIYVFSAGGFVGDAISGRLLPYFNLAGTTLLLLCFLCTGLTLMTGLSWLALVDYIGDWTISGLRWLGRLPAMLQDMQVPSLPKRTKATAPEPEDIAEAPMASRQEPVVEPVSRREPVIEPVFTMGDEPSFDDVAFFDEPEPVRAAPTPAPVVKPKSAKDKPKTLAELEEEYAVEGERPSFNLLDRPDKVKNPISPEELEAASRLVEAKLLDFNIEAKVVGVYPGPVITRFELDLAPGVKVAKISSLSKDLARALSAISVRVVEVIPGKSVIGLELPNKHREMVRLSEVIECDVFQNSASNLTMVLGKDIAGKPVVVDLAKMPHLLVAGTTGSGKSVGVNVMMFSLLYKSSPEDVRLIMIDPKMLELSVYEGIPHLLAEVVTDMKEAANALRWCVGEMERRYRLMSALGVRNLKGYNAKIADAIEAGEPIKDPLWKPEQSMDPEAPDLEKLPSIVVVVDEFADMMMIVGKKVEELIA
ncbi:DNA translocase FtsK 4TM domain-containing protein, partial [Bowmanella yangjiangensis]|uniref:DNA translocase FtsK 4TM domain-containing protein n=1 Tax=Bowmanella yangjiangensis TaxID=2811230 RepID=UPI001E286300